MSAFSFFFPGTTRFTRLSRRALAGLAGLTMICLSVNGAVGDPPCPDFAGNDLTVPNNCTYTISSTESYFNVTVKAGGTLELASGAALKIRDTLTIHPNGTFRFNDQTEGTPPILKATFSLEITGDITTTDGADEGGVISMETAGFDSVRLVSGSISSEYGPVSISADFENDGTITANGGADGFDVSFSGAISNGSVGTFQVTAVDSEMIFCHDVSGGDPSLTGDADFNIEAGLMHFQQSLTTAGGYRQIGGKIRVNAGKTFTANGAY